MNNTTTDQALLELLPWYINNTLDEQQRNDVDALLLRSDVARKDLANLQALAEAIKNQEQHINDEHSNGHEMGWARLQKNLRAEPLSSPQKMAQRNWWKPSLAAAAAVILALQITIIYRDSLSPSQPAIDWQTLSTNDAGQQQTISAGYRVQIRFVDTASWENIRKVLQSFNARIIEGPSTLGIVQIYIPDNGKRFANDKELLQILQQQAVIQHAAIAGKSQR
jgi:hypothetical protein